MISRISRAMILSLLLFLGACATIIPLEPGKEFTGKTALLGGEEGKFKAEVHGNELAVTIFRGASTCKGTFLVKDFSKPIVMIKNYGNVNLTGEFEPSQSKECSDYLGGDPGGTQRNIQITEHQIWWGWQERFLSVCRKDSESCFHTDVTFRLAD